MPHRYQGPTWGLTCIKKTMSEPVIIVHLHICRENSAVIQISAVGFQIGYLWGYHSGIIHLSQNCIGGGLAI